MTSQQYADAMLAAWHYRRDFIARQLKLPISASRVMAMADDNFTLTVKELSQEYEESVKNAPPIWATIVDPTKPFGAD
jgi:hypothetical protein